jgi:NAD(P)-dependent dehydrogenase (short-subunit alcohol dehydrogenase family)
LNEILFFQKIGRIINVSSVNGNCAYPGIGVYCASKFGIEGLSDVLRIELSKFEVKVIVIKPGDFARLTNIMSEHESNASEMWRSMDDNKRKLYANYFTDYHKSVLKNSGITSPTSFENSTLIKDFEEAVLAVDPRLYIISASFVFRVFFFMVYYFPTVLKDKLLNKIVSNMVKFDVNQFK